MRLVPCMLAIVVLMAGALLLAVYFDDFVLRFLGVLLCIVGAYLVRASKVRGLKVPSSTDSQASSLEMPSRPGRLAWALGVGSAVMVGVAYFYLYKDALGGYHQVWPVRIFAASAMFGALVWSYLGARLM